MVNQKINKAVIGLGSNINPNENIARAIALLTERLNIVKASAFQWTKPVGYVNQDDFKNGSVLVETPLELETLKRELKAIEKALGRPRQDCRGRKTPAIKSGPRTIDLDITVWNNKVVDQDLYKREFLHSAALELIPNLYIEEESFQ